MMSNSSRITSVSQFPQLGQVKCKLYMVVGVMRRDMSDDDVSNISWFLAVSNNYAYMVDYACVDGATVWTNKQLAVRMAEACKRQFLGQQATSRKDGYRWVDFYVEDLCGVERHFSYRRINKRNRKLNNIKRELDELYDVVALPDHSDTDVTLPKMRPSLLEFSFATGGNDVSAVVDYLTSDVGRKLDRDEFRTQSLDSSNIDFINRHCGVTDNNKLRN